MNLDFHTGLAGLLVGIIVGITGVGGGALMTPILVMLFGIAPATAVGTDLLYASATKIFGAAVHHRHGTVDWPIVRLLACGSLPAAGLTLIWMHSNTSSPIRSGAIITALGAAMALTALGIFFSEKLHAFGMQPHLGNHEKFQRPQPGLTIAAGIFLGVMVTLTSVGAGALGTVMLIYLYPLRLSVGKLVGTDLAHAIPLTLIAGLGHLSLGNVNFDLMLNLLAGSIPGILLGSLISIRAPVKLVRYAIAAVLLLVSYKMLMS